MDSPHEGTKARTLVKQELLAVRHNYCFHSLRLSVLERLMRNNLMKVQKSLTLTSLLRVALLALLSQRPHWPQPWGQGFDHPA